MKIPSAAPKVDKVNSKVKPNQKSILERDIQLFPHQISDKEKETIYRQLSVLQRSGVDIRSSFEILFKQIKSKQSKEKLRSVLNGLIKGKSLSESMSAFNDFSAYEIYSLKIGEETGRLTNVLERLMHYFENKIAQRRLVVSALSYPLLIVLTSMGAVSFMILFIIPMFEEVFLRFGKDLPALTQTVIGFSHGIRSNGGFVALIIMAIFGSIYFFRKNEKLRYLWESMVLRTPMAGEIYRNVYMARFCDSMSLLISASVPMLQAFEMIQKMIGFLHIEYILDNIKSELVKGKSLSLAFEEHNIFDDQMKALIKVGEEVNQLGSFFEKLAQDYSENVKHRTSLLSTFLEPMMIVFLGAVVGIILLAMYMPMFELSSNMNFGN